MESHADFWDKTKKPSDPADLSSKTNSKNDSTCASRRSSDGGPPPFNRNRSFKMKQLVRSQAIRESQSPPRIPSPRPAGISDTAVIRRIKSASVDLDDRPVYDNQESKSLITSETLKKNVINQENSFKITNLSSKNILVITSGDKRILGAHSVDSNMSLERKSSNKTPNISEKAECDCQRVVHSDNVKQILKPNKPCYNTCEANEYSCENHKINSTKSSNINTENNGSDKCLNTDVKLLKTVENDTLIKTQALNNSFNPSDTKDFPNDKTRMEFKQIEVQVTLEDSDFHCDSNLNQTKDCYQNVKKTSLLLSKNDSDYGIGPSIEIEDDETEDENESRHLYADDFKYKRALCPAKQDSGVCCWDSCNYCEDVSPEMLSDNDDENRYRLQGNYGQISENDSDIYRLSDKNEKWNKSGSNLTVQRSGGNPRLLRKQSSGGGSVDSGRHSITSPYLSRDSSSDCNFTPCDITEVSKFIKETLNKSQKDRLALLKIEHDLVHFVKDSNRKEHKFPATTSYGRLLVHRCADLFGLRHIIDPVTRHAVTVSKVSPDKECGALYKIPGICPFQQWCTTKFPCNPPSFCESAPQAKSILKRDTQSLEEEPINLMPQLPKLLHTSKSKSFEQREEEYVKARRRIFNSPGRQVQSLETENYDAKIRGMVLKAHSFGGYGERQEIQRGDSVTSASSAPPQRILSRQGELASSDWRLSPCSSGYKTLSARSDSITPSPTSTPNVTSNISKDANNDNSEKSKSSTGNSVLWAISDMSKVPSGAVIIHAETGEALTNSDGTIYHYDPSKPLHTALLPCDTQNSSESIKILSNLERRRYRLEKQRATHSPASEVESVSPNHMILDTPTANQDAEETTNGNQNLCVPSRKCENEFNVTVNDNITFDVSDDSETKTSENELNYTENSKQINERTNNDIKVLSDEPKFTDNTENTCIPKIESNSEDKKSDNGFSLVNENKLGEINTKLLNEIKNCDVRNEIKPTIECIEKKEDTSNTYATSFYSTALCLSPPNFYSSGQVYEENNNELYENSQTVSTDQQRNEQIHPSMLPGHLTSPHAFYTSPEALQGFTSPNEMCYPPMPAHVLIPPSQYGLQEQEPQSTFQQYIPAVDQQPVMVTFTNKLPESEISAQPFLHQLINYPLTYHSQVERTPVISPSQMLVNVPPPSAPLGYQLTNPSNWGYWPHVALYAHQLHPNSEEIPNKYPPHHSAFLPHVSEVPNNTINLHQHPFYPHSNQYYPPYHQQPAIIPSQFTLYQPYNVAQGSITSQEGCSTPGLQPCDMQSKNSEGIYQEDLSKNVKPVRFMPPKIPSNSGSSRATPLTNNPPLTNHNSSDINNIDPYNYTNPAVNCIQYHYPYYIGDGLHTNIETINFINKDNEKQSNYKGNKTKTTLPENYCNLSIAVLNNSELSQNDGRQIKGYQTLHEKEVYRIRNNANAIKIKEKKKNIKPVLPKPLEVECHEHNLEYNNNQLLSQTDVRKNMYYSDKSNISKNEKALFAYPPLKSEIITNNDKIPMANAIIFNSKYATNFKKAEYENKGQTYGSKGSFDNQKKQNTFQNNSSLSQIKIINRQYSAVNNPDNSAPQTELKSWRKSGNFNQKESIHHNFPKNLNKQMKYSNSYDMQNLSRPQSVDQNIENINKSRYDFEIIQSSTQITPTSVSAPPVPWNVPVTPPMSNINHNMTNNPQLIFSLSNTGHVPNIPVSNFQRKPGRSNDRYRSSSSSNAHLAANSKGNPTRKNSSDSVTSNQQRYIDYNIGGSTFPQNTVFQRSQTVQNLNSNGLSLVPTPPLQGQPTFLFRQVPGWYRRPQAPMFGSSMSPQPQARTKPSRHHYHPNV